MRDKVTHPAGSIVTAHLHPKVLVVQSTPQWQYSVPHFVCINSSWSANMGHSDTEEYLDEEQTYGKYFHACQYFRSWNILHEENTCWYNDEVTQFTVTLFEKYNVWKAIFSVWPRSVGEPSGGWKNCCLFSVQSPAGAFFVFFFFFILSSIFSQWEPLKCSNPVWRYASGWVQNAVCPDLHLPHIHPPFLNFYTPIKDHSVIRQPFMKHPTTHSSLIHHGSGRIMKLSN